MSSTRKQITIAIDIGASSAKVTIVQSDGRLTQCRFPPNGDSTTNALPATLYVFPEGENTIVDGSSPPPGEGWAYIQWFKFLVLHPTEWPRHALNSTLLVDASSNMGLLNMTVIQVIGSFLKLLWPAVKYIASSDLGISNEALQELDLHLVMTVPANWKKDAINRMNMAVKESKILETFAQARLTFMPEQAAAMVGILGKTPKYRNYINEGDLIVICDCGSLSVDIGTYEVKPTTNDEWQINECLPGTTRLCGAFFIEDAFQASLRAKIIAATGDPEVLEKLGAPFWSRVSQWWERSGRDITFMCAMNRAIQFPFASLCPRDPKAHFVAQDVQITFSGAECLAIQTPVVNETAAFIGSHVRSIRGNLNRSPKYVFLSGGFARNYDLVRILCESIPVPIEVANDGFPDLSCVADGAALQGHQGRYPDGSPILRAGTYISRRSYAVLLGDMVQQNVHWLLKRGSSLSPTIPTTVKVPITAFSTRLSLSGHVLYFELYYTTGELTADASEVRRFAEVSWSRPTPELPSESTLSLEVFHDAFHGLSLLLNHNDQRVPTSEFEVEYDFTVDN